MRFKLGNKKRKSLYWEEEEKEICRLCGAEEETWEHVWERCRVWKANKKSWQEGVEMLGEAGDGE